MQKTASLAKPLTLLRQTLRHLTRRELDTAAGGCSTDTWTQHEVKPDGKVTSAACDG